MLAGNVQVLGTSGGMGYSDIEGIEMLLKYEKLQVLLKKRATPREPNQISAHNPRHCVHTKELAPANTQLSFISYGRCC